MYAHNKPVHLKTREMLFTYCVCDFVLWLSLYEERKHNVIVPEKNLEFEEHTNLSNLQV